MDDQQRILSVSESIREGLIEAAMRNPAVVLMGEGISDHSSVYGTTSEIGKYVEAKRIIEMPVAENAICGIAVGAALMGKRPVVSFHRVEFALLAMEQIVNNAAKAYYISNGRHKVPLVIRMIIGRGWGQGPEHSQSMEAVFSHFPGLKVIMPTYPQDAKGLVIAAVEDDNPVLIIEHRWCHYTTGHVPKGYYTEPLDGPRLVRHGRDVTIVSTSYMTLEVVRAVEALEQLGYSATVFDLRVLRPLTLEKVFESVRQTGRLLTVDTGHKKFGIGAEVVSEVVAHCFSALKSAPMRMGLPDHPAPSSLGFLPGYYPEAMSILRSLCKIIGIDQVRIEKIVADVIMHQNGLPIDVPDPFFKGPF